MKYLDLPHLQEHGVFRYATPADVPALLALYAEFYEEAAYKDFLDYDDRRVQASIDIGVSEGALPHILGIIDGEIAGFLSFHLDHSFSVKPCLVMHELFVRPDFRRSAVGRVLVGLLVTVARDLEAGAIHAPVCSGLREMASLKNLFAKAGFDVSFGFIARRGV